MVAGCGVVPHTNAWEIRESFILKWIQRKLIHKQLGVRDVVQRCLGPWVKLPRNILSRLSTFWSIPLTRWPEFRRQMMYWFSLGNTGTFVRVCTMFEMEYERVHDLPHWTSTFHYHKVCVCVFNLLSLCHWTSEDASDLISKMANMMTIPSPSQQRVVCWKKKGGERLALQEKVQKMGERQDGGGVERGGRER